MKRLLFFGVGLGDASKMYYHDKRNFISVISANITMKRQILDSVRQFVFFKTNLR